MLDTYILSGIDYRACAYSVFGEPVTFIGYPTSEGNGNLINSLWSIAISSNSEYKDAAWDLSVPCYLRIFKKNRTRFVILRISAQKGFPGKALYLCKEVVDVIENRVIYKNSFKNVYL